MQACKIRCLKCGEYFDAEVEIGTKEALLAQYSRKIVKCPICRALTRVTEIRMPFDSPERDR
jgi:hypothetical protein